MIIDSHQHFWQVGRFDYPWMSTENEVLYRDYLPEMLEPTLRNSGVSKTVLVQASNSIAESHWLLDLADTYPFIAGVVGWIDLKSSAVDQQLDELSKRSGLKGIRHLVESEPEDDWLVQREVVRGLERLSAHGLSYDLLVHTRHLKYAKQLLEQLPDLAFVLDHMAKPPIAKGEIEEWSKALAPLAAHQNLYCKLSGLVTEASWSSWTTETLRPYVDTALKLFGSERLMFGSDHPVCLLSASYERVLDSFRELLSDLSSEDLDCIFFSNAARFYRLSL